MQRLVVITLLSLSVIACEQANNAAKKPVEEVASQLEDKPVETPQSEVEKLVGTKGIFRGMVFGDTYNDVMSTETAKQEEISENYISYMEEDSLHHFYEYQYTFQDSLLSEMSMVVYCTDVEHRDEFFEQLEDYYLKKAGGYSSKSGVLIWEVESGYTIELKKIGNEKHPDIQITFR